MANSVDPDQTAPFGAVWSGSTLFAYVILSDALVFEFLGHLPYVSFPCPTLHDKTYKMACAPSEDSDQPGHPPSLISLPCPHEKSFGP